MIAKWKGEKLKVSILEEVEKMVKPFAVRRKTKEDKLGSTGCLIRN